MGRDTNVYSANRWSVGLLILVAGGVGVCLFLFYPLLDAYIRSVPLRRTFGFFRAVPPDVTIWSMRAIAAASLAVAVVFLRVFIDPRMVSVDANGIRVRHPLAVHRGRWVDFTNMKVVGKKGLGTIQLFFKKAPGGDRRVNLPPRFFGVDMTAVVADISVFIMEPKKMIEGSLDKYDPKKFARQLPAATDDEPTAPLAPAPRRRFGKRTAA